MHHVRFSIVIGLLVCATMGLGATPEARAANYAVVLMAGQDSPEGSARAMHAFLYVKELKEHGHEVVLIFDGAGTTWAEELSNPESQSNLKGLYDEFMQAGVLEIVCDYCATAFGKKQALVKRNRNLVSEYEGHPSIAKWLNNGYQLITL